MSRRNVLIIFLLLLLDPKPLMAQFFNSGFWQSQLTLGISTAAPSTLVSLCSSAITIQTQNAGGVATSVTSATTIDLASTGSAVFYSDSQCTQPVTQTTIASGSSTVNVYVLDSAVESFEMTFSSPPYPAVRQTGSTSANGFIWKGTTSSSWSVGSNWSNGVSAPTSSDVAVFDGTCTNCNPTFSGAIDVKGIRLNDGYAGTFTQGAYNIQLRSSGLAIMSGVTGSFTGATNATYNITVLNGLVTIGGGTFTAPAGSFIIHGGYQVLGTPSVTIPSGSTLDMECGSTGYGATCYGKTITLSPGTATYANLIIKGRSTSYSITENFIVGGSLTFGDVASSVQKWTGSNILVYGPSITQTNSGYYSWPSSIVAKGNAGGQTITGTAGINFPSLQIDAGIFDVTLVGTIRTISYANTSVGTLNVGGSTLHLWCTTNYPGCYALTLSIIPGSSTLNNVRIEGNATNYDFSGGTLNVAGTLTLGDQINSTKSFQNGTINAYGDLTLVNQGYRASTTLDLNVKGNPSGQTITGSSSYYFPNLVIDAGANNVIFNGYVRVHGYQYVSGNLITTGSTLYYVCGSNLARCYNATHTLDLGNVTYNDVILNGYATNLNFAGRETTIQGNLTLGDLNNIGKTISSGTLTVLGNVVVNNNGYRGGTGIIKLGGNASGQTIDDTVYKELPTIELATGTNPVQLVGKIRTPNFKVTSAGAVTTTGSTVELYCANGIICYNTTQALSLGTITYDNLTFHGWSTDWNLTGSSPIVSGTLTVGDQNVNTMDMTGGTISVTGDVRVDNNGYRGSTKILLKGHPSGQTIYGLATRFLPTTELDTGTNSVTLNGSIRVPNWTVTSVGTLNTTGSNLEISCNNTAQSECYNTTVNVKAGTYTYDSVAFHGYRTSYDLGGGTILVAGSLSVGDVNAVRPINNGAFTVFGGLTSTSSGNNGNAQITMTGSSAQTISFGANTIPGATLTVQPTGGATVSLASTTSLSTGQTLRIKSGTVNMAGYNLSVPGTLTIDTGAVLTKNAGTLTYGTLNNSGTINP